MISEFQLVEDFAQLITATGTGPALRRLRDTELPHLIGITDDERRQLQARIGQRFCELNHAALGPQNPRWK